MVRDTDLAQLNDPADEKSRHGNDPVIFDPTGLISHSAHGRVDTIQKGFSFTEGPAVDRHGNVFFTDQPNDRIYKWRAETGKVTLFLQGTGRANGMAFDREGNLIACADMHGELWKIRPDGSHTVLVNNYKGKLLNGPNDVWINPVTGGIYITDPIFPRDYWDASDPRKQNWEPTHSEQAATGKGGHVYYLAPRQTQIGQGNNNGQDGIPIHGQTVLLEPLTVKNCMSTTGRMMVQEKSRYLILKPMGHCAILSRLLII